VGVASSNLAGPIFLHITMSNLDLKGLVERSKSIIDKTLEAAPRPQIGTHLGITLTTMSPHSFYDLREMLDSPSRNIKEEPYEGCMLAKTFYGIEGQTGGLLIRFPNAMNESDLSIHRHRFSSRTIVIYRGWGFYHFIDERAGIYHVVPLMPGAVVDFPKGLPHNFTPDKSDGADLVVYALHTPFQPLNDEDVLTPLDWDIFTRLRIHPYKDVSSYLKTKV